MVVPSVFAPLPLYQRATKRYRDFPGFTPGFSLKDPPPHTPPSLRDTCQTMFPGLTQPEWFGCSPIPSPQEVNRGGRATAQTHPPTHPTP